MWARDGQVLPEMQSWHCTHQLHTNEKNKTEQLHQHGTHSQEFDRSFSLTFLAEPPTPKGRQILNDHAILKKKTETESETNFYLNFVTFNNYSTVYFLCYIIICNIV